MTKHYHVHAGLSGCMPSFSQVCLTIEDATFTMVEFKRTCEASVEHTHRLFTGKAKRGWYLACHPDAGVDYVERVPCYEDDCLEEER